MQHPRKIIHLLALTLAASLTVVGCASRPELKLADPKQPTVGQASASQSFWRDSVEYAFPVKYAQAKDARGNDWEIAYMDEYIGEDKAKAKTLVLVHGKGANMGYFSEMMQAALEAGLRVVAFDIPYYGKSIPGNLDQPIARTLEDTRVAAHDLIVNQLGIEKATYLGHSMGGQWVLGYVLNWPEVVDKVVLEGSAGLEEYARSLKLGTGELPLFDAAYTNDYAKWEQVWTPLGLLKKEYDKTPEDIRNFYYFKQKNPKTGAIEPAQQGYFKQDSIDARFLTDARVKMIEGSKAEYDAYVITYIRDIYALGMELNIEDERSLYKRLDEITVPVFMAFGEQEPFIPTSALSGKTDLKLEIIKPAYQKLAKQGAQPVVKLYPGVGHFIHTDVPAQFNEDVIDFVYRGSVDGPTVNPMEFKQPKIKLPQDIVAFVDADTAAVKSKNTAQIMGNYHPDFRSDGRDLSAQQGIFMQYGDQLAQKYVIDITGLKVDGDRAELEGSLTTSFGKANLKGTQLIKQDGKWRWYGNRK
jgi:pimeloyl-ACP methyl ester carboxylesterase